MFNLLRLAKARRNRARVTTPPYRPRVESLEDLTLPSTFVTVDLSPYANTRIQNYQPSSAGYPEGMVTLGGIPFNIQTVGGNNAWNAEVVSGPYPHVLAIPLSIAGATEVHSLINTFYGQPGPTSYITLEFFGTGGAYFKKELIGNVDVRDHFYAFWTNSINGTTTTNVYSSGGGFLSESRLDKQEIDLPAVFAGETMTEFRLTSTGGVLISDASIQGLTVVAAEAIQTVTLGTSPAALNLAANGAMTVTLFSTPDFDALEVDIPSVIFAGAHAFQSSWTDVDFDGDLDLVMHFRRQETNLSDVYARLLADADQNVDGCLDAGISNHQLATLLLTGRTMDGARFQGTTQLDLFLAGVDFRRLADELAAHGLI